MKDLLRIAGKAAARALVLPILFYQKYISVLTPAACRFTPTCSEYARQAILRHGAAKGLTLAVWRVLRCNPWGGYGYDPVPEEWPKRKTRKKT